MAQRIGAGRRPAAPPNDAPSLLESFAGNQQQNAVNTWGSDQGILPPDPDLAAGTAYVIETTNDRIMGFDRSGALAFDRDINTWLSVSSGWTTTDARVIYDAQSGRFFFSTMEFQQAGCGVHVVVLASPANGDLNATWDGVLFNSGVANTFGDQPGLGVSDSLVVVGLNLFDCSGGLIGNPYGSQLTAIQKSDLLANTIGARTVYSADSNSDFSAQPVEALGPSADAYVVENGSSTFNDAHAYVYTVTGTPQQNNVAFAETDLAITQTSVPPLITQAGTSVKLESDDDRFLNAVTKNGAIWTAASTACTPAGDTALRSCLDYVGFTLNGSGTPSGVTQVPFVGTSGAHLFYPAVSLDAAGDVFSVFGESSGSMFPSIMAASIDVAAGGATLGAFATLRSGATYYDPQTYDSNNAARWGDYYGAAADPAHPTDVWMVGENVDTSPCSSAHVCWDTYIGRYTLAGPSITSLTPAAGPVGGAQSVTIAGSDFLPGSTVTLGGAAISSPAVTPDAIQITTPAHAAGLVYAQVTDTLGTTPAPAAAAGYLYTPAGTYTPVTPFRIYDSRAASCVNCGGAGPLTGSATRAITIAAGAGAPANQQIVPTSAIAVVLNVTVVNETARSFLSVWPGGTGRPAASNLNFIPGLTVANLVTVVLGQSSPGDADREVDVFNNLGSTDVVIDVAGYFAASASTSGTFHAIPPLRICDSRAVGAGVTNNVCNHDQTTAQPLGTGVAEKINVTGPLPGQSYDPALDVPSDGTAEGVVLNLTAVLPQSNTYLSVYPPDAGGNCNIGTPPFSNVNLHGGGVQPNRIMVLLGPAASGAPDTDICVWNYSGQTNFILDLNGWYGTGQEPTPGQEFQPIGPTRVCDTRVGTGTPCSGTPLGQAASRTVQVTTGSQVAALMNVTAVLPTTNTFVSVYPADVARSFASDLNPRAGLTAPNLVVVKLSAIGLTGAVDVYNNAGTLDFILDVGGWFQ